MKNQKIVYWISIRTAAATEKDKWLECSNCGNHINMHDLEEIRLSNLNNYEQYKMQYKRNFIHVLNVVQKWIQILHSHIEDWGLQKVVLVYRKRFKRL